MLCCCCCCRCLLLSSVVAVAVVAYYYRLFRTNTRLCPGGRALKGSYKELKSGYRRQWTYYLHYIPKIWTLVLLLLLLSVAAYCYIDYSERIHGCVLEVQQKAQELKPGWLLRRQCTSVALYSKDLNSCVVVAVAAYCYRLFRADTRLYPGKQKTQSSLWTWWLCDDVQSVWDNTRRLLCLLPVSDRLLRVWDLLFRCHWNIHHKALFFCVIHYYFTVHQVKFEPDCRIIITQVN